MALILILFVITPKVNFKSFIIIYFINQNNFQKLLSCIVQIPFILISKVSLVEKVDF